MRDLIHVFKRLRVEKLRSALAVLDGNVSRIVSKAETIGKHCSSQETKASAADCGTVM